MSDENEPSPETGRPAAYEIRVRGHLGSAWSDWFTGLRVTLEDHGDTLLAGPLDQAALHGVLRRVRDLGMPLLSVTRIESGRLVPQASIKNGVEPAITTRWPRSAGPAATIGEMTVNTKRGIAATTVRNGMSADRKAAVWIGVLYIIGTVGLVLSVIVTGPVFAGPAVLAQVAAQPNQVAIGALLVLLAGVSLAMVPVVFWPIGKRYNETLAMGYVVFRGGQEMVMYIATALAWLLLIALSANPDAAPLAGFVRTVEAVAWDQLVAIPFVLGALMFYVVLYRSRLVPRWLSVWGLVGAALYIVAPLGGMFGHSVGFFMAPLAVQEMVLAVWLIAKGFNQTAIAAEPAGEASRWQAAVSGTAA